MTVYGIAGLDRCAVCRKVCICRVECVCGYTDADSADFYCNDHEPLELPPGRGEADTRDKG